ncbi:MAG: panthothenate synthetase [Gammaproteobacteria bacterium]|jgi:hypothetical protein|nr:panthothenate synthetase [Gammaproteobacteria bacterium]
MRVLINIIFPPEPFNSMVRDGTTGAVIAEILEEIKPEAAYFYAPEGCRGGTLVVNIDDPSQIPAIAEPFFLRFEANCEFHIAMTPEDLGKAGLDSLGKKWG